MPPIRSSKSPFFHDDTKVEKVKRIIINKGKVLKCKILFLKEIKYKTDIKAIPTMIILAGENAIYKELNSISKNNSKEKFFFN